MHEPIKAIETNIIDIMPRDFVELIQLYFLRNTSRGIQSLKCLLPIQCAMEQALHQD